MSKDLRKLSIDCLDATQRKIHEKVVNSPIKIMQVGEGNFLMSFFDWMVYQAIKAGKFDGSIALTCSLNYDKKINLLNEQDMLYTVIQRGFKGETEVYKKDIVSVFSKVFNYNVDWDTFMKIAEEPSLEVIISNTTEAGLAYKQVKLEEASEALYPAKLTAFLMHRFEVLNGESKKLLIFPCELVEENGNVLEEFVMKHAEDFGASDEFKDWLDETCLFLNNLVDRIVPGYPGADADNYFQELGYVDGALSMCEPYFLWAIEGSEELDKILPLNASGLNVQWLESLHDTHLLKVRILNGSHTLITPYSILQGFKQVDEVVEDEIMKIFLNETLNNEILPSIKNETGDSKAFASIVLSRFRNQHINHKLESISMNSISKFKNRLLPTIKTYIEDNNSLPNNMIFSLAGLIRFYQIEKVENGYIGHNFEGETYPVFDTPEVLEFMAEMNAKYEAKSEEYVRAILEESKLWGEDLTKYDNMIEKVTDALSQMELMYV